jgi:hypothetical protein
MRASGQNSRKTPLDSAVTAAAGLNVPVCQCCYLGAILGYCMEHETEKHELHLLYARAMTTLLTCEVSNETSHYPFPTGILDGIILSPVMSLQ